MPLNIDNIVLLIIVGYLLIMNIVTFFIYKADKKKAQKGTWRTPESTLILLAFVGGSVGAACAMKFLRHKTKHVKFLICIPLALLLHIAIAVYWIFWM